MSTFLYPRLARELARPVIESLRGLELVELLDAPPLIEGHTFAPIGGRQVTEQGLLDLREQALTVAAECGFPETRTEADRIKFDRRIARLVHTELGLTPHQAADEEIWTHLSLGPMVALASWRFPGLADDRVLGRAPRNTFRRLWWRAEILGPLAWNEGGLLEDETVQIMERSGMSANPAVARALARTFLACLVGGHVRRMDLMRDALKRVNRLTPFIRMETLSPTAMDALFDELFEQSFEAVGGKTEGSSPTRRTQDEDPDATPTYRAETVDRFPSDGVPAPEAPEVQVAGPEAGQSERRDGDGGRVIAAHAHTEVFEEVPLGRIVELLAQSVTASGMVSNDDLRAAFSEESGITVPGRRTRLLTKLAWSARGRGLLQYDEDEGIWRPGENPPARDDRFGDWTFGGVIARASELLREEAEPFERLLAEVSGRDRAPRIIASVVGSALHEAKRSTRTEVP